MLVAPGKIPPAAQALCLTSLIYAPSDLMTIAGHGFPRIPHTLEVLVSGVPDPFWDDVRRHVTSWLIICGVGGIGYLAVQVPLRLDRVLVNQEAFAAEVRELKAEMKDLEVRIVRQEQLTRDR